MVISEQNSSEISRGGISNMLNNVICKGCKMGPCIKNESALRPVLTECCKSNCTSSDLWRNYDFTRVNQCMDVIKRREDVFQCDFCGFLLENHMRHTLIDGDGEEYQLCTDCYQRCIEALKNGC